MRRGGGAEASRSPQGGLQPHRGFREGLCAGGRRARPLRATVTQPGSGGHDSGVAKVTSRPLRLPAPGAASAVPLRRITAPPARTPQPAKTQRPPRAPRRSPGLARVLLHLRTRRRPRPPCRPDWPLAFLAPTNRRRGRDGGCRSCACAVTFWPRPRGRRGAGGPNARRVAVVLPAVPVRPNVGPSGRAAVPGCALRVG